MRTAENCRARREGGKGNHQMFNGWLSKYYIIFIIGGGVERRRRMRTRSTRVFAAVVLCRDPQRWREGVGRKFPCVNKRKKFCRKTTCRRPIFIRGPSAATINSRICWWIGPFQIIWHPASAPSPPLPTAPLYFGF